MIKYMHQQNIATFSESAGTFNSLKLEIVQHNFVYPWIKDKIFCQATMFFQFCRRVLLTDTRYLIKFIYYRFEIYYEG